MATIATFIDVHVRKHFLRLWLAHLVSIFGDMLALFGVQSLITFRLHGTATQVTAIILAYHLPMAIFAPFAGVLVDHWNVKQVMIGSDLLRAVLVLFLVFATDVRQICLVFAILAIVSSLFSSAQSVALTILVPKDGLLAANARMSQALYAVRLLSPALAALLVTWLTERACFYLDSLSFLFSGAMISTLVIVRATGSRERTLRALAFDFFEGNKFIFSHRELTFVSTAMAMAVLVLSCFNPLISIYIRDSLSAGSITFGIVSSMFGFGLLSGTQHVIRIARNTPKTVAVLQGLAAIAVSGAFIGIFSNLPILAAGYLIMGFAMARVVVPSQTLLQETTPPELLGRVSSSFISLTAFAQAFGLLLSGYFAQRLGIRQMFVASAVVLTVVTVGAYFFTREEACSLSG
ncbi:MAG: major facilitator superfamily transporter [Candidatus Angelobacter sp.]|nr:major facilitator superfamily transporter [Candidatus Angelobacter sp.]